MARIFIEDNSAKINEVKPRQIVGPVHLEAFREVLQREGMHESLAGYVEDMITAINNPEAEGPLKHYNLLAEALKDLYGKRPEMAIKVKRVEDAARSIMTIAHANEAKTNNPKYESARQH